MDTSERLLITQLADRMRAAAPIQKDILAAELIQREIGGQRDALYVLTQTVLLQEEALRASQAKIEELTTALAAQQAQPQAATGGGFLSGMFGRNSAAPSAVPSAPQQPAAPVAPAAPAQQPGMSGGSGGGGGFLKTAGAAAAGVVGGGLLFQGLSNAFGGSHNHESGGGGYQPETEVVHETTYVYESPDEGADENWENF